MSEASTLSVKPIIHYPREAQVGKTYLMTIDLELEEDFCWQYDGEDYPIYCRVESDLFLSKPVGEPVIVLHRFGGSYGEAKFLLTAALNVGQEDIKVFLSNTWGVIIKVLRLEQVRILAKELKHLESGLRIERDLVTTDSAVNSDRLVNETLEITIQRRKRPEIIVGTVLILTALPVEYMAVQSHLEQLQEVTHPQGTIYEKGHFTASEHKWDVYIVEVGAGNAGAAVEAARAIANFKPDILFSVGIAGGIKDVKIGDVVTASKVYGYESGKKVGESFFPRPEVGQLAYAVIQQAQAEARKEEWSQRLPGGKSSQSRVFVAPIAAGERVTASKHVDLFPFLQDTYSDAIAIEMEGVGFLSAAFAYPDMQAIVIRGISDLIDSENFYDSQEESEEIVSQIPETERQVNASQNASAFAFQLLSQLKGKKQLVKVFISYSHDSQEHKDRVLVLADQLRKDGLDANIDQYEDSPPEGWLRWMRNQVEGADYVLVVCTEQYDRRFRGREERGRGKGGTWEGAIITQELYDAQGYNSAFIPIVLTSTDKEHIPLPLRSATSYRLYYDDGYEQLYRRLTDQHEAPRSTLGQRRTLVPRERKQVQQPSTSELPSKTPNVHHPSFFALDDQWVGRSPLIKELSDRIRNKCRLLILVGINGIGKTALGERLVVEVADWFEGNWSHYHQENFDAEQQLSDFASVASRWLEKWGELVTPDDRKDPQRLLDKTIRCLRENRYVVQMDSSESILHGNEEEGWSEFKDEWWLKFFDNYLKNDICESCLILTSNDLPGQLEEIGGRSQNFWHCQPLSGLDKNEQIALFEKTGLDVSPSSDGRSLLERIGKAYEGYPLALRVIAGEIKNRPFNGNVIAYWNKYGGEIEEVENAIAEAEEGKTIGADDQWQLDRFTKTLRRNVRSRLAYTVAQLKNDAKWAYIMLCEASVYRCAVPEDFWLSHLEDWGRNEDEQKAALETLRDRYLIEELIENNQYLLRQHNLIRSISLQHLRNLDEIIVS